MLLSGKMRKRGRILNNYLKKNGSALGLTWVDLGLTSLLLRCFSLLSSSPSAFVEHSSFLSSGGNCNRGETTLLGRQLKILGRSGSKGEAWTEENRRLGRRREERPRRGDREFLSRVLIRSAAGRRACTVSHFLAEFKTSFLLKNPFWNVLSDWEIINFSKYAKRAPHYSPLKF